MPHPYRLLIFLIGATVAWGCLDNRLLSQDLNREIQKQLRLFGQEAQEDEPERQVPPGVDVYMGRRVAQTMHYTGAEWLIRDVREREERCSLMLANLGRDDRRFSSR